MTAPIDIVLGRLDRFKLRPNGAGRWRACCPAHGGNNPTALSIGEGQDGAVLLRCWHGCEVDAIAQALGLELCDLFPPKTDSHGTPKPRRVGLMSAGQAIELIRAEFNTVWMVLASLKSGTDITADDLDRAVSAADRVEMLCKEYAS
jgi:hypothetical protein